MVHDLFPSILRPLFCNAAAACAKCRDEENEGRNGR